MINYPIVPIKDLPHYWEIEDLIYPGHTVIGMSQNSGFFTSLVHTLELQNNPNSPFIFNTSQSFFCAKLSTSKSHWNRDPLIKTYSQNTFFVHKAPLQSNMQYNNSYIGKRDLRYNKLLNFYRQGAPHELASNHFEAILNSTCTNFMLHTLPLAGGNIITPRRTWLNKETNTILYDEKPVFVVGRSALLLATEAMTPSDIEVAARINPQVHNPHFINNITYHYFSGMMSEKIPQYIASAQAGEAIAKERTYYAQQYLAAKTLLRTLLTSGYNLDTEFCKTGPLFTLQGQIALPRHEKTQSKKNVCFVNQWAYHIDLQMLYIGFGTILVHDFSETRKFLEKMMIKLPSMQDIIRMLLEEALHLEAEYQHTVDTTVNQLNKFGLHVIRVTGLLIPNRRLDTGTVQSNDTNRLLNVFSFNFMNSIAFAPMHDERKISFSILVPSAAKDNVLFRETADSIRHAISNKLTSLFNRLITINIIPIEYNAPSPLTAEEFMIAAKGGLRCQTALYSKKFFEHILPVFQYPGAYAHQSHCFPDAQWIRRTKNAPQHSFVYDIPSTNQLLKSMRFIPSTWVTESTVSVTNPPQVIKKQEETLPKEAAHVGTSSIMTSTSRRPVETIYVPKTAIDCPINAERDETDS